MARPLSVGVLAFLVALFLTAGPRTAFGQNVNERFKAASNLFDQNKTSQAYKLLVENVRKYPDHQPTRLLLGRILFRAGQVRRAAAQFKRVSPELLRGEEAYEYGVSFFQLKDYRRAKSGFAQVPASNKLYDLACFYRGLSLIQTREYQKAQFFLKRAERLPQNLVRSRKEALASLKRKLRDEQSGRASPTVNPYMIFSTPPPQLMYGGGQPFQPEKPSVVGPPVTPPAAPKKPPPPQSGLVTATTPSLTVTQSATSADYFGTKTEESEKNVVEMKLALTSKYSGEPRSFGAQTRAQIGVDVSQVSTDSRGSSVEYKAPADRPTDIIETETATAPTSSKVGYINLTPEIGYPVSAAIDLTLGVKYKDTLPDMETTGKINSIGPYGSFEMDGDLASLKLTGSNTTTDKPKPHVIKTSNAFGGEVSKSIGTSELTLSVQYQVVDIQLLDGEPVTGKTTEGAPILKGASDADFNATTVKGDAAKTWETFSLKFSAALAMFEETRPDRGVMSGERQSMTIALSGTRTFDFGGSLDFGVTTVQLTDYTAVVDNLVDPKINVEGSEDPVTPKILAKGNGSRTSASLTLKLTPVDWLFGSATYEQSTLAVAVGDPKAELGFQKSTAEVSQSMTLQAGLSKSF